MCISVYVPVAVYEYTCIYVFVHMYIYMYGYNTYVYVLDYFDCYNKLIPQIVQFIFKKKKFS
jgi:hypothetical protein